MKCLEDIAWVAIDVLRIGYVEYGPEPNPRRTVTVFVSVEPASTAWTVAYQAVTACVEKLRARGLWDVDVDVKESTFSHLVDGAPTSPPKLHPWPLDPSTARSYAEHVGISLSELLGVSIESRQRPDYEGTKGLYLKCRRSGRVFALTCRHVVIDQSSINEYRFSGAEPRIEVIQPPEGTFTDHQTFLRGVQARPDDTLWARIESKLDALTDIGDRVVGSVASSPALDIATTPSGRKWLRDWALIELDPARHTTALVNLQSRVFLGLDRAVTIQDRMSRETAPRDLPLRQYLVAEEDGGATARIVGVCPEKELQRPSVDYVSAGAPAHFVVMCGQQSGLRTGMVNEVRSVLRNPLPWVSAESHEMCIIGTKFRGPGRDFFSADGDSGACIWDLRSRACGLLVGGLEGQTPSTDVSYATPMERLLEDIKSFGFDANWTGAAASTSTGPLQERAVRDKP
ncbi:hypothetical protein GMORB2_7547 [Geosmithia morbida]|uniref:Uncharacterized protein n=1 Tax=Geosmithia morbida TaxID=1094350 RepID=A0A9P5D4Y2_9HYPO|nr:uncharacterized protein GMORB2_7547 [Geosmithia morbida]KAF4121954.1 hypothetical protein GMORB2_7547 [Geosmithia morbida]